MFQRLLVANRGEVALRIQRACAALGVETVQAYSQADDGAPWVESADRTVCIGPAAAAGSYLHQSSVLQAALQHDCQAVHPGYGFLAENAVFAARCESQGLTFVGPPADAIRRMGNKSRAKSSMAALGLPTIPGSPGVVADIAAARTAADAVGYPVLLKAVAGGGGRGMRVCRSSAELDSSFPEAAQEALSAFGDGGLYVEKLIRGGRHIEFQVLVDGYGTALHLGERECSIQRSHQKLLEESPSPTVDGATREELGGRVARAVGSLGYRNAGTVEFLRTAEGRFYFMELNARLQVEHPVTEMVTGLDLVEQQLRIAANQPLALQQGDVVFSGHAIELRINAEDPACGFRPDPGEVRRFRAPTSAAPHVSVRWDSAIRTGYRIPPHYDSMIGKLIVHGPDRETAIEGALAALESLRIDGVRTTAPLHEALLRDPNFRRGDFDVDFLETSGVLDTVQGTS